jgi:hypothetical protein
MQRLNWKKHPTQKEETGWDGFVGGMVHVQTTNKACSGWQYTAEPEVFTDATRQELLMRMFILPSLFPLNLTESIQGAKH